MKPLKLKNPPAPGLRSSTSHSCSRIASVSVKVPVPHLEGEYSYLVPDHLNIGLGSLVRIPFGSQKTTGFVTELIDIAQQDQGKSHELKEIEKVVNNHRWFDPGLLERSRRISSLYGGSLHSILNLAVPRKAPEGKLQKGIFEGVIAVQEKHQRFVADYFGTSWLKSRQMGLILTPGILWERIIASLLASDSKSTLVLIPQESLINRLIVALREIGISDVAVLHSSRTESERAELHQLLLQGRVKVLIGTRSAALAPFRPERVIVLDAGDSNYRERRHPYFRVDEMAMWQECQHYLAVNHAPTMEMLASGMTLAYSRKRFLTARNVRSVNSSELVKTIAKLIPPRSKSNILVSINDRSFVSSMLCALCKNVLRCDCGFPMRMRERGGHLECSRCAKVILTPRCKHCHGEKFLSYKGGAEKWALTLGKSISGSTVMLSNSDSYKPEIRQSDSGALIVLATHGCEPIIVDESGRASGYQLIALIGGNGLFNSPSFTSHEESRVRWGRALGLLSPKDGVVLADLDAGHPEFRAIRSGEYSQSLAESLKERRNLNLPPFSVVAEIRGEPSVLSRLRTNLEGDRLFAEKASFIFPIQESKFLVKVSRNRRFELLQLLQGVIRLRSSKRLSPISFILEPDYL